MKRLIWLPIAGFLLIAGAAVAAASPGLADTAKGLLGANQQEGVSASSSPAPTDDSTDSSGSGTEPGDGHGHGFGFMGGDRQSLLDDVLADLVADGTITQAQADAITSALQTAADEKIAELEAQHQQMQEMWTQIKGFLEDGVITSDEIAQLPADNPFTNLTDILADGQITQEELDSVMPFDGFFMDGKGGHRFHFGPGGGPGPGGFPVPDSTDDANTDSSSDTSSNS